MPQCLQDSLPCLQIIYITCNIVIFICRLQLNCFDIFLYLFPIIVVQYKKIIQQTGALLCCKSITAYKRSAVVELLLCSLIVDFKSLHCITLTKVNVSLTMSVMDLSFKSVLVDFHVWMEISATFLKQSSMVCRWFVVL